jgi:hypothetical protein
MTLKELISTAESLATTLERPSVETAINNIMSTLQLEQGISLEWTNKINEFLDELYSVVPISEKKIFASKEEAINELRSQGFRRVTDGRSISLYNVVKTGAMYTPASISLAYQDWYVEAINGKGETTVKQIGGDLLSGDVYNMNNPVHRMVSDYGAEPMSSFLSETGEWLLNTWRGWATKPKDITSAPKEIIDNCELWLSHIKDIICNGEEPVFQHVIAYMAHMFQHPEEKPRIAICIKGEQGCGKGAFWELIKTLCGREYTFESNDSKDALGTFNKSLVESFVVNMNEWHWDEELSGVMKGLVTDMHQKMRKMYVDAVMIKSYTRYIITTNEEFVIRLEQGDRRYFMMKASSAMCGTAGRDYFKRLFGSLSTVAPYIMDYLLHHVDISEWIPEDFPRTEEYMQHMEMGKKPFERYMDALIARESLDVPRLYLTTDKVNENIDEYSNIMWAIRRCEEHRLNPGKIMGVISLKSFTEGHQKYMQDNGVKFITPNNKLTLKLRAMFGDDKVEVMKLPDYNRTKWIAFYDLVLPDSGAEPEKDKNEVTDIW